MTLHWIENSKAFTYLLAIDNKISLQYRSKENSINKKYVNKFDDVEKN